MQNNAPGGKGPCFGQAGDESKREGMAGTARSNHPEGREQLKAAMERKSAKTVNNALTVLGKMP